MPAPEDTHTAAIEWGDGTSEDVDVAKGSGAVNASHAYAEPGGYEIVVRVSDDDSGVGRSRTDVTVRAPDDSPADGAQATEQQPVESEVPGS